MLQPLTQQQEGEEGKDKVKVPSQSGFRFRWYILNTKRHPSRVLQSCIMTLCTSSWGSNASRTEAHALAFKASMIRPYSLSTSVPTLPST